MTGLERAYTDAIYDVLHRRRRKLGLSLNRCGMRTRRDCGLSIRGLHALAVKLGTTASALMREAEERMGWEGLVCDEPARLKAVA